MCPENAQINGRAHKTTQNEANVDKDELGPGARPTTRWQWPRQRGLDLIGEHKSLTTIKLGIQGLVHSPAVGRLILLFYV